MQTYFRKRLGLILAVAVAFLALLLPGMKFYVHSQLGAETAALFPQSVTVGDMVFKGASVLPVDTVPALSLLQFSGWLLMAALAVMLLSLILTLTGRDKALVPAFFLSLMGTALSGTFAVHLMNLDISVLFQLLLTVQFGVYVPFGASAVMSIWLLVLLLKDKDTRAMSEKGWRITAGVVCLVTALMIFLPAYVVQVPDTVTEAPADAAAMNRSVSVLQAALGRQPMLNEAKANGQFQNVLSGDLLALEPFSGDGNNIRGIFLIPESSAVNVAGTGILIMAVVLLLAAVLCFLGKVDKWFPAALTVLSVVLGASAVLGMLMLSSQDMYTGGIRQLLYLGLGAITPVPLIMVFLALFGALCCIECIRAANEPYFVSPVPKKWQIRGLAALLAVLAVVCLLMPGVNYSFYKPGKTQVQSTASLSTFDMLRLSAGENILVPKDKKGAAMYEGTEADSVRDVMVRDVQGLALTTWAALILTVGGLVLLLKGKAKKPSIACFLTACLASLAGWILLMTGMPSSIGTVSCAAPLFMVWPLLIFAAFFTSFSDQEEIPKKYKLFLMMLPFLVAVLLFSYLPLYGWSYAFYNYKFGQPLSEQEFVGFKWFTEMWTNPANRENIVRVLKNTFGMSGLNLATSFLPMVFAIFLNEITNTRFKKFVQIFTTLPNFISWALVFSFAMCLFAMDTGIFSKFMLAIGAIKEPVVWLNSSEHIWLKMWAWSTWKGLGWGAIMYLAAIAGIDQELYEAAKVDGANRWHQMRYITLPGLLPTFFVLLMLSISNILNNGMEQYLVFQNPMNKATIEVLDLYVYNITIASRGTTLYSFGTAIGILKTLVSVTLLFTANFASKKLRGESIV